jgi:putative membrane protein
MSTMNRYNPQPSRRWLWFPLAIAAAFVAVATAAWYLHGPPGPAYAQGGYPGWWFPFPWFFFIPVFFLVFFGLRWFFWGGWGWGWYQGGYVDPALETLRERFAKGEITKDQYDQMRRDLEASRA